MRRDDICLYLGPADRAELQALIANCNTPRKLVWRAEIVLATAEGHGTFEIMRRARTSKPTVWRWQARYLDEGVAGLKRDKTRPSRVPPLPMETRLKVIAMTVQETPHNATHWSRALMAEAMGISPSSVGRIWADAGLKPHLVKGFNVSNDPMFEEKVTDIVGLYLDPPDRAVVLCVDEKSRNQALDRTQPGLPLKKGRAATMSHDYKRHGTTTLVAALDVKSGKVIGDCMPRHRAREFLKFLRNIDKAVHARRDVHLVLDSEADQKTVRGLLRNPGQAVVCSSGTIQVSKSARTMRGALAASFLRFMAMAVSRAWIFMFSRPRRIALPSPRSVLAVPCVPSTRHRWRV